jgi:methionyl-tRNA formyltransferase
LSAAVIESTASVTAWKNHGRGTDSVTRLVFMGTPRFGELVLSALVGRYDIAGVITQPDREAGRGRQLRASAVKALAEQHGLRVLQPATLRHPETLHELADLEPDVIVVAAYGKILPASVLTLPRHCCINVHASLLPRHRGAAPIPAAILAGDAQAGVTIMIMAEEVDSGPILSQAGVEIAEDDTTGSLTEKLGQLGGTLLAETLPKWLAGEVAPKPQGSSPTPYASQLRREDGRIDWREPAEMIARRCRAFYPWPGAFAHWGQRQIKVLRARPRDAAGSKAPGTVVQVGADIAVATGHGLLVVEELLIAGKRPLPALEFVRGQRAFVGAVLD